MSREYRSVFQAAVLLIVLTAIAAAGRADAQRSSGGDLMVLSATLKSSGDISGEFRPLDQSNAKLQGACNDASFANFGLIYEDKEWRKVSVTVMTKDGIASGQTGPIALDWALVSFMDSEYTATQFRGPAEFVITTHDAGAPRMAGIIKGTIPGYGGMLGPEVLADRSIDFEFTFEIAASCGEAS
jgi:hypothetical protein